MGWVLVKEILILRFLIKYIFNIIDHMRVWLTQLDGSSAQAEVAQDSTLENFLQEHNLESMRLVCQGSNVTPTSFLALPNNATLWVQGGLEGGKRKRKKKVYTTKKKNKHIHKKVTMGIYTLYNVDGTHWLSQARAM